MEGENSAKLIDMESDIQYMDKKFILTLIFLVSVLVMPFAATAQAVLSDEELDYAEMVTKITKVRAPYIQGDYLIFTAKKDSRFVGVAFDFENFHTIHAYKIHNLKNNENEVIDSIFFYILKIPKRITKIAYRMVVDGLWTVDPENEIQEYDMNTGLVLSAVDVTRKIKPATEVLEKGLVRFVYQGRSGQQVRLGGSFTNWDSWIYEMKEVKPGLYQFELSLPPGTYQYAYFSGMNTIVDTTNPERCYTRDGKTASQITVR